MFTKLVLVLRSGPTNFLLQGATSYEHEVRYVCRVSRPTFVPRARASVHAGVVRIYYRHNVESLRLVVIDGDLSTVFSVVHSVLLLLLVFVQPFRTLRQVVNGNAKEFHLLNAYRQRHARIPLFSLRRGLEDDRRPRSQLQNVGRKSRRAKVRPTHLRRRVFRVLVDDSRDYLSYRRGFSRDAFLRFLVGAFGVFNVNVAV